LYSLFYLTVGFLIIGIILQSKADSSVPDNNDGLGTFDIRLHFDNFVVPNASTNYMCKGFYLPSDEDYHAVKFEPIKDNQEMLHHMILYTTDTYFGDDYFECTMMPKGADVLFPWAVGSSGNALPENVGFRLGKSSAKYAALQIHYDNPNKWSGRMDSSGFKITVTKKLRPIEAGYLVIGAQTSGIRIPPASPFFELSGTCNTSKLPDGSASEEGYHLLGAGLHMHTFGRQIYTEHFRPDPVTGQMAKIGMAGCDNFYNFNDQKYQPFPEPLILKRGDHLVTHCVYDSTSRNVAIKGCESTDCEMCLNFIPYYPKLNSSTLVCVGTPTPSTNNSTKMICD